ncbi:MAG: arylsulfatase [Luteolibacter sp.]
MKSSLATALLAASLVSPLAMAEETNTPPNIIYILADDLGYGDVQVLNPERGKIATPHMDKLAAEGMIFTDAHSSSSVCTPTRYGIITGRYNWRSKMQAGVLSGFSKPLIDSERLTVAGFLKEQGYSTACIGKWHIGMNLPSADGKPIVGKSAKNVDWKGTITGGPVDLGFDYYYGIAASLDMPPYIWIENDHFVGECTVEKEPHPQRKGPAHVDFEVIDVLPETGNKTVEYINEHKDKGPFFAYVAFTAPHTPTVPGKEWQGKSGITPYADFVMHTDAVIGQIADAVDAAGIADNTMIIVTSDNGCSKAAPITDLIAKGHYPSAQFRGSKSDLWDGGHRVPFLVRWPAGIKAGSISHETICLTDLMATCADLTGAKLPDTAGEDSVSFLPALGGKPIESARKGVIHHSIGGKFAYREGKWKLLLASDSGGWTKEKMPKGTVAQLYDMEADPGETTNLYDSNPEVVERLMKQLESDVARGRSTAGVDQKNDAVVKILKGK